MLGIRAERIAPNCQICVRYDGSSHDSNKVTRLGSAKDRDLADALAGDGEHADAVGLVVPVLVTRVGRRGRLLVGTGGQHAPPRMLPGGRPRWTRWPRRSRWLTRSALRPSPAPPRMLRTKSSGSATEFDHVRRSVSEGGLHQIAHGCCRRSFCWLMVVRCERSGSRGQVVDGARCAWRRWDCCGRVVRAR